MSQSPLSAYYFKRPQAYVPTLAAMEQWVHARIDNRVGDSIFFLEHTPVITLGMRGREDHIRVSSARLQHLGIDRVASSRGGEVTLHAPGQLVIYPILKLSTAVTPSASEYVRRLEEWGLQIAADFGVPAFRRKGLTGIWTDSGKLGAIGVRFRRWVSFHGLSLNIDLDLKLFDLIVPCGLDHEPVASFKTVLGKNSPSVSAVRLRAMDYCEKIFGRPCIPREIEGDWPLPASGFTGRRETII